MCLVRLFLRLLYKFNSIELSSKSSNFYIIGYGECRWCSNYVTNLTYYEQTKRLPYFVFLQVWPLLNINIFTTLTPPDFDFYHFNPWWLSQFTIFLLCIDIFKIKLTLQLIYHFYLYVWIYIRLLIYDTTLHCNVRYMKHFLLTRVTKSISETNPSLCDPESSYLN